MEDLERFSLENRARIEEMIQPIEEKNEKAEKYILGALCSIPIVALPLIIKLFYLLFRNPDSNPIFWLQNLEYISYMGVLPLISFFSKALLIGENQRKELAQVIPEIVELDEKKDKNEE